MQASKRVPAVGIIGTGWGVSVQVPAFRSAGWNVAGLCARNAEKAKANADKLEIPFSTATPSELFARPELDLITIVFPPHTHKELAEEALKAGKHVLCDKPTALNAAEAQSMFDTAQKVPKQLSLLDFELRSLPTFKEARAVIKRGQIGKVWHVKADFYSKMMVAPVFHWWYERSKGGGLLGAVGSHMIDYVSWILGDRIVSVQGHLRIFEKEKNDEQGNAQKVTADDSVTFLCKFASGVTGEFTLNMQCNGPNENKVKEIIYLGDKGTMHLEFGYGKLDVYAQDNSTIISQSLDRPPKEVPQHLFGNGTYHLAKELKEYLESPDYDVSHLATFDDGLYVQKVMDAVRTSSDNDGTWVSV